MSAAGDILRVAIVGHTNTGKTSLLRTLSRDASFGDVSDRPSTTRGVTGIGLLADGIECARFLDTPGLEDSIALLEHLDTLRGGERLDGPELIARFLESREARSRFAPEALALRALLECDAGIYVIDARDRVLPKHRDELEILARCGRPIVPLLNFVVPDDAPHAESAPARIAAWREVFARSNLHAVVEFDTVVFDSEGEIRLFEMLEMLLDRFRLPLRRLVVDRRIRRQRQRRGAFALIAELLVDAAAIVEEVRSESRDESVAAEERLRRAREREARCVRDLLALFAFRAEDCVAAELPLVDGAWAVDLFSPAALKRHGIHAGGGAAAGAAAGVVVDLAVGGITLGAAAGLGALIGAAAGAIGGSGKRLLRRARGGNELRVGDGTLARLAARELELVHSLFRRGHASVSPVRLAANHAANRESSAARHRAIDEAVAMIRREVDPGAVALAPRAALIDRVASLLERST